MCSLLLASRVPPEGRPDGRRRREGGLTVPQRSRKRAQGLFDLIGLGGDFDSLLIAFIFAEVMSLAVTLRVNNFKWRMNTFS